MNLDELRQALIAAARGSPSDERVPHLFEKRVMARLSACAPVDVWGIWARALWRAAATCIVITLALAAWHLVAPAANSSATSGATIDVAQEFENIVLAAAEQESPADYTP